MRICSGRMEDQKTNRIRRLSRSQSQRCGIAAFVHQFGVLGANAMNSTVHVDLWSWSIWSSGDGVDLDNAPPHPRLSGIHPEEAQVAAKARGVRTSAASLKPCQLNGVSLEPYRADTKWTLRKSSPDHKVNSRRAGPRPGASITPLLVRRGRRRASRSPGVRPG